MTTLYPFQQWQDIKQDPGTDLLPFSQWYDSVPVSTACYNQLFGKGNYAGPDAALEGHWELQDDAVDTVVVDRSGKGRNGVLAGAGNTEVSSVAGPKTWLPKAIDLDGTNDTVNLPQVAGNAVTNQMTYLGRVKLDSAANLGVDHRIVSHWISPGNFLLWVDTFGGSLRWGLSLGTAEYGSAVTRDTWYDLALFADATGAELEVNGVSDIVEPLVSGIGMDSPNFTLGSSIGSGFLDGVISDHSLFTRVLSSAERSQWRDGPEPYLLSGTPTITGTVARGSTITLSPGVWSSQSNGVLYYTYRLYSYSDTSGGDQRLEKVITHTALASQNVILRGAAIVGRYLRYEITVENAGGFDPQEVYWSAYSVAVAAGTDPAYTSYNMLFGKGKHLQDANLLGIWNLQETTGTLISDNSVNFRNGTLFSGSNPTTIAGPTSYLANAIQFGSSATAPIDINYPWVGPSEQNITVATWVRPVATTNSGIFGFMNGGQRLSAHCNWGDSVCYFDHGSASLNAGRTNFNNVPNVNIWKHYVFRGSSSNVNVRVNGVSASSHNSTSIGTYTGWFWIGGTSASATYPSKALTYYGGNSSLAGFGLFNRILTDTESDETYGGPEPLNIIIPSAPTGTLEVGQTLTAGTGTWNTQSNGTVTYEYQWYRADDISGTNLTAIGGATNSTYTLVSADENKYITVLVRGLNDGGFDEAEDTFSVYSAQIQSGTTPISKSFGIVVESLLDVSVASDVTTSNLLETSISNIVPVENLLNVSNIPATDFNNDFNNDFGGGTALDPDLDIENLLSVSTSFVINVENTATESLVSQSFGIPVDSLLDVTSSNSIPNDSILDILGSEELPVENLLIVSKSFGITVDTLGSISTSQSIAVDNLLDVSINHVLATDPNLSVATSTVIPLDSLQNITATQSVPTVFGATISVANEIPVENKLGILSTSTLAEDTLLSVSAIHEIPVVNAGGIQKVSAILLEYKSSLTNIATITIPIETTYRSHNKIFGLGNHTVPHPELRGYWPLQEMSGTTVYDVSGNDEHLTLFGMAGTDPNVTIGPTTYLPSAFEFWPQSKGNPVIDKVQGTIPAGFNNLDYFTMGGWANYYDYPNELGRLIQVGSNDALLFSASGGFPTLAVEGTNAQSPNSYQTQFNQWHFVIGRMNTSEFAVYFNDGDDVSNPNVSTVVAAVDTFCIGNIPSGFGFRCFEGGLAGMFAISDYISDQELQEIKAGPEPYLQSGSATIAGTIARGELVTLNAGTWNSQNNGVITYTYRLYSYSDTDGNNERLEKEIVTTITSRQVLLNDNIVEGRYLRVKVTAENDGGGDLLETYYSAYTVVVASGSDYIVNDSYNALFGRGKHLQDQYLASNWALQDDEDNTILIDSSINGRSITLSTDSSIATTTGPNSWLPKAINFVSGTIATTTDPFIISRPQTHDMSVLFRCDPALPGLNKAAFSFHHISNDDDLVFYPNDSAGGRLGGIRVFWREESTLGLISENISDIPGWHNYSFIVRGITNNEAYRNGALVDSSNANSFDAGPFTEFNIGDYFASSGQNLGAPIADLSIFARALALIDIQEWESGPEPLNLIAPSAPSGITETGATLTANTGFWDTQSNGSLIYSYEWTRSDDTLGTNETIVGTDSPTYTLVFGDLNKYIRCRIRASNDGGYDSLEDTFSAFTAQIELGTFPVSRSLSVALDSLLEIEENNANTVELLESVEQPNTIPNTFSASISSLKNIAASFSGNIMQEKDIIIDTLISVENTNTTLVEYLQQTSSTNQIPVSSLGQFTLSNQVVVVDTLQQTNSIQTLPISSLQLISADKEIPFDGIGSFLVDRTLPISTFRNIQAFNEVSVDWLLSVQKTDEIPVYSLQNVEFLSDILIDSSSNLLIPNTLILEYLTTYEYTSSSYIWTLRPRYQSWPMDSINQIWTFDTRGKIWSFGAKQRIWCIINRERVWIQLKKK